MPMQINPNPARPPVERNDSAPASPRQEPAEQADGNARNRRSLRNRFMESLARTPIGREISEMPFLDKVAVVNDPLQPPLYQVDPADPGKRSINMREPGYFGSADRQAAVLTHEAIHALHHFSDPEAYEKRKASEGTHAAWTNAEEELTITGDDPTRKDMPKDPFNENAVRAGLGMRQRNSARASFEDLPHSMNRQDFLKHQQDKRGEAQLTNLSGESLQARAARRLAARPARPGKTLAKPTKAAPD